MRITWDGHAAFRIETRGLRIILDPYRSPDSGGYEPIGERADIVVVSHENDSRSDRSTRTVGSGAPERASESGCRPENRLPNR